MVGNIGDCSRVKKIQMMEMVTLTGETGRLTCLTNEEIDQRQIWNPRSQHDFLNAITQLGVIGWSAVKC
jgi:hypothetical protein